MVLISILLGTIIGFLVYYYSDSIASDEKGISMNAGATIGAIMALCILATDINRIEGRMIIISILFCALTGYLIYYYCDAFSVDDKWICVSFGANIGIVIGLYMHKRILESSIWWGIFFIMLAGALIGFLIYYYCSAISVEDKWYCIGGGACIGAIVGFLTILLFKIVNIVFPISSHITHKKCDNPKININSKQNNMVSFPEAVKICMTKKYATFSGRATRSEFWWFQLFVAIIGGSLYYIEYTLGNPEGIISGIVGLAFTLPTLSCTVRRCHDAGFSGWYIVFVIVGSILLRMPYLSLITWFFALLSSAPDNKYGPKNMKQICEAQEQEIIKEEIIDVDL